jgi:hypothetical protein
LHEKIAADTGVDAIINMSSRTLLVLITGMKSVFGVKYSCAPVSDNAFLMKLRLKANFYYARRKYDKNVAND